MCALQNGRVLLFSAVAVFGALLAHAQEVAFVDLTGVTQRTQIRYPAAIESKDGHAVGSGFGGASIACGAEDPKDKRSLRTTLLWLDRDAIRSGDLLTAEIRVANAGSMPLAIPVHPHLSDVQPKDESQKFNYEEFSLVLQAGSHGEVLLGSISLYGSPDKPETMVTVRPDEWVRVRAEIRIGFTSGPSGDDVNVGFWWHHNTVEPHPGGYFTQEVNVYPRHLKGEAKSASFAKN